MTGAGCGSWLGCWGAAGVLTGKRARNGSRLQAEQRRGRRDGGVRGGEPHARRCAGCKDQPLLAEHHRRARVGLESDACQRHRWRVFPGSWSCLAAACASKIGAGLTPAARGVSRRSTYPLDRTVCRRSCSVPRALSIAKGRFPIFVEAPRLVYSNNNNTKCNNTKAQRIIERQSILCL